jgi:hypothetical protein
MTTRTFAYGFAIGLVPSLLLVLFPHSVLDGKLEILAWPILAGVIGAAAIVHFLPFLKALWLFLVPIASGLACGIAAVGFRKIKKLHKIGKGGQQNPG